MKNLDDRRKRINYYYYYNLRFTENLEIYNYTVEARSLSLKRNYTLILHKQEPDGLNRWTRPGSRKKPCYNIQFMIKRQTK